jgi:hypothetical protein
MFMVGLCAVPAPITWQRVQLEEQGNILTTLFEATVDKPYPLFLRFTFNNKEDYDRDLVVGKQYCLHTTKYSEVPVDHRSSYGHPIPLRVVITKAQGSSVVLDETFQSICAETHAGKNKNRKQRLITDIALERGHYSIQVFNLQPFPDFRNVITEVGLMGGRGK